MYDITKTRMLLTTSVFAAVAALSASGANARIPADSQLCQRSAGVAPDRRATGPAAELAGQGRQGRGDRGRDEPPPADTRRAAQRTSTGGSRDSLPAPRARRPPYSRSASLEAAQPPS